MFFLLFQLRFLPAIAGHHSYLQNKYTGRPGPDENDFEEIRPTFLSSQFLFCCYLLLVLFFETIRTPPPPNTRDPRWVSGSV